MSKSRIIRVRRQGESHQEQHIARDSDTFDVNDDELSSKSVIRKKPTMISGDGFISWIRKIVPTREGMESHIEEPLIIAQSGHRVKESEIKGRCDICGGYDSHIFNCHIYGCKKSLCLRHVYFFEYDKKKLPYCLEHYKRAVDEFDTWQAGENRWLR